MYDFSNVKYNADYSVNFTVTSEHDPDQKIQIEASVQINNDEITFSAWGAPSEEYIQRLLLRSHFHLPNASLENVASSIVEILMDSHSFHKNVEALAMAVGFDSFSIDEEDGINIVVYPLLNFTCPKEVVPSYLHGDWANELTLEVKFSFTEKGTCDYSLHANLSISETRIMLASGNFTLNCKICSNLDCPHKHGTPFGPEDTAHFAGNILGTELTNHSDEIHDLLLHCEEEILDGKELPRSLKIGVIGRGKNTVFIAPEGISEEDAEAVQALQSMLAGLDDEEDEE